MNRLFIIASIFFYTVFANSTFSQSVFINEFHYDNTGSDANEFVEVAVQSTYAGLLSDIVVYFYNGFNGSTYIASRNLFDYGTQGSSEDGFTFYTINQSGIQNGPDGFALTVNGALIEFISYGGSFTATSGPANGISSTDIGVFESDPGTAAGSSLQRTGDCNGSACPTGLSWTGPSTASPGSKNASESLPIELTTINVVSTEYAIKLKWQTATEINSDYMLIERSQNGVDFKKIGRQAGAGTTLETQDYSFTDRNPAQGVNYYRLKQVDFDGTFSYSKTISVYFGEKEKVRLYPTLAAESVNIEMEDGGEMNRYVQVFNTAGILVSEIEIEADEALKTIDVSKLQEGNYIVKILTGNEVETLRFVKM